LFLIQEKYLKAPVNCLLKASVAFPQMSARCWYHTRENIPAQSVGRNKQKKPNNNIKKSEAL